jgi:hypothetical protein
MPTPMTIEAYQTRATRSLRARFDVHPDRSFGL